MELQLLQQGAEARVYSGRFQTRACVVKERFSRSYRHPTLDTKLRQKRTAQEVRSMMKCRKHGIATPSVFFVENEKCRIYMENLVTCHKLRDVINRCQRDGNATELLAIAVTIGEMVAKMHDIDVIHGDLTTSNFMIDSNTQQLKAIDFGLSSQSSMPEEKGVDLYVLERCFLSTHPNTEDLFQLILDTYKKESKNSASVIAKLDQVRLRGRKRTMVG
ncbi:EKC/KEOPS complex subunit TP53RK-like [Corticium candelabrum]|uniref:EKC/KEOPS complex subunit TP53RK-like n=1 Tax=Corticium candelabrum TaxID=121492 RepID=UPI002E253D1E|nr:EKC/KEOPS complex subunit TP53RK-like [Corticium candelabrum]